MSEIPKISDDVYSADELGQYQAISPAAVLALLLGLISSGAFLSPMLLMVPLAAVAVAFVALSRINSPRSGLSGARLAYAGLALAILFAVAACTRFAVSQLLLNRLLEDQTTSSQNLDIQA